MFYLMSWFKTVHWFNINGKKKETKHKDHLTLIASEININY